MKKSAPLFVLLAATLWGSMGIVTRYVASLGFHTRQTAAVRICAAAIVLFVYMLIRNPKKLAIKKEDFKWFLGTGLGSLFINNLAYAETVQRASLSVAVVLLYTAPFFVMIMSALFFGERLTGRKITALLLSFVGCSLTVGIFSADIGDHLGTTILFGLCAGFAYSLYSIFGKVLIGKYDSLTVTTYTFLVAAVGTLVIAEPVQMAGIIRTHLGQMPLVVLGSVITLAIPYISYSTGLSYMESSKASILASFEVVAASLFGVILYQEKIGMLNGIGIICVLAALILLNYNGGQRKGNVSEVKE